MLLLILTPLDIIFHICRLDDLILEAISNLKEPTGSNKTAIALYIEVLYFPFLWLIPVLDLLERLYMDI